MGRKIMNKSYEIDMCHGPLLKQIIIFSVPLMLSGILQLLLNAVILLLWGDLLAVMH